MIQTQPMMTGNAPLVCVANVAESPCRAKQWELVEFAGEGSLARIYRARPIGTPADRPATYAVKMLRPCWQNDPEAIRLLRREASVGQSVSHPHLVPVLTASVAEPPRLLVMPWLEGASLHDRLAARQQFDGDCPNFRFSENGTVPFDAGDVAKLDALHAAGWMHGDVTPGNIHVSPTGHVTLIDLSFARRREETGSVVDRPIMGTCSYIAPEYFTSALRADIRSDLYSLGVVLFEMLSGRLPYFCKDLSELATQFRQGATADLARLAPHVPREVAGLVQQMTAREPLRRPQSPRELIDRLVSLEIGAFAQRLA